MRPNLSVILAAIFCFIVWWGATTFFVDIVWPYMESYR